MSVFRIKKTANYTVMSNYHLKDRRMSLKAKGMLSLMLSLPDDWDYSQEGLIAICKESETAIKSTLKELKELGYLSVEKKRTDKGTFEYIYDIFEKPQGEKPEVENLGVDKLGVENVGQLNTNNKNTKNLLFDTSTTPLDTVNNNSNIEPISHLNPLGNIKPISHDVLSQDSLNFKEQKPSRIFYAADAELNDAFCEFLDMREAIGKPVTSRRALIEIQNDLKNLSGADRDRAIKILVQSIKNSWCSLRPLQDEKPPKKTQIQKLLEL